MCKTELFVQLPWICTVIFHVYNYIHEILERMVYSTASPRENSAVCSVFLHHHNIFNTKQNMVLSNNSCSFKFYFKKIKLNNISIYKRQFFLFLFFFYKISLLPPGSDACPLPCNPLRKIARRRLSCLQSSP